MREDIEWVDGCESVMRGGCVADINGVDVGSAEVLAVAAASEVGTEISGETADVEPGAGGELQGDAREGIGQDFEAVKRDRARRDVDFVAFSGEVVHFLTVDFYGRKCWRNLIEIPEEIVVDVGCDCLLGGWGAGELAICDF